MPGIPAISRRGAIGILAAALTVARILGGTSPGDIPVAYPPDYSLLLNKQAAERIGLAFPRAILEQAHETFGA